MWAIRFHGRRARVPPFLERLTNESSSREFLALGIFSSPEPVSLDRTGLPAISSDDAALLEIKLDREINHHTHVIIHIDRQNAFNQSKRSLEKNCQKLY